MHRQSICSNDKAFGIPTLALLLSRFLVGRNWIRVRTYSWNYWCIGWYHLLKMLSAKNYDITRQTLIILHSKCIELNSKNFVERRKNCEKKNQRMWKHFRYSRGAWIWIYTRFVTCQAMEIVQPQSINELNNFTISVKIKLSVCVSQITSTPTISSGKKRGIVQTTCRRLCTRLCTFWFIELWNVSIL